MNTSRVSNPHRSASLTLPPYKAVEAFTASSNSLSRLSSKNIAYSLSPPASERQSAHWAVSSHRTQSICHSFDGSKMSRPISLERSTLSETSHSSFMTRISSQTLPPPPSYPTTHTLSLPPPPYLRSPIRSTIHNAWIGSRAVGDFPLCASRTSALRSTAETLGSPEDELKDSFVETARHRGVSPPGYPRGAVLSCTRENSSCFREAPRFHGIAASACESDDSSCESDSDSDSIDSLSTRCDLYVKAPPYSHSSSSLDEPHTPLTPELRPLHSFNRSDSRGTINSDVYDDMDVHVADEDEEITWRGPRSPSFRPGVGASWNDFRGGHRTRSGDFIIINDHSPFLTKKTDRAQPRTHPGVNLQCENRTQPTTRPTIASLCLPPADVVATLSHQNPNVSAASSSSSPSPSTPSISSKRKAQEVDPMDALEDAAASGPKPKRSRSGTSVVHEPIKASIPPPVPDQEPIVQEQISFYLCPEILRLRCCIRSAHFR
ncbi:hypothetical protein BS47DRAFT_1198309 [Hydnum rufescens UP504]|uniref:Uncharacterized protein n=1 Tax=Hydnum rufescens UP504 TaxID=1448309 RepID=A0A9P6ASJ0_9AGAM|nr:hypothetical protein BS47DRAFT_1198309 [Hydnum rufescens UP504]